MKNITLLWLCIYCCSCTGRLATSHVPKQPNWLQMQNVYADSLDLANRLALDSLGFRELYEDAKWRMYCIHCDEIVRYDGLASHKTYGQLKCFLSEIQLNYGRERMNSDLDDYVALYFDFVYDEPHKLESSFNNVIACVYNKKSKQFYCYLVPSVACMVIPNCPTPDAPDRCCNPLQPDVVKYIIANQKVIDSWFYLKAKEKGVFWK